MILSPMVQKSIHRGYLELKENRLTTFTMVLVTSINEFYAIDSADKLEETKARLVRLLQRYPISAIVVGAVESSGHFESFVHLELTDIHD
jgi:hypothetical protein